MCTTREKVQMNFYGFRFTFTNVLYLEKCNFKIYDFKALKYLKEKMWCFILRAISFSYALSS